MCTGSSDSSSPTNMIAVLSGLAAAEPLEERRRARVGRGVPRLLPGQQVRVLLEAVGELVLGEPFQDGGVGGVGLRDETGGRRIVVLLTPVHCDLSLGNHG